MLSYTDLDVCLLGGPIIQTIKRGPFRKINPFLQKMQFCAGFTINYTN